jgi:hypothetical protein
MFYYHIKNRSFYGRPTVNMMSATMPILCSTNAASVGTCDKKFHGTPEKATARAVPRKWSSWSGIKGEGRDGAAVCAEVCRPSCRWAKARRQKIEIGEKVSRRKKGIGAEERRQLRRRLLEVETRVEELEGELEKRAERRREEQRAAEAAAGRVRELEAEVLQEKMRSREREEEEREQWLEKEAGWRAELRWKERVMVRAVGREQRCARKMEELRKAVEKERMEWKEKEEGWRAELKEVVERQWAAEVVEVRRAVGREQKWARRVEVLKAQLVAVEGRLRKEQRLCKEAVEGAARGRAKVRRRFRPGQRL